MAYERSSLRILYQRLNEKRKFIQTVIGPRQVGKTTMVKQFLDQTDLPFRFESADAVAATDAFWIQ